jgi:hypothetical protein
VRYGAALPPETVRRSGEAPSVARSPVAIEHGLERADQLRVVGVEAAPFVDAKQSQVMIEVPILMRRSVTMYFV